jgi:hypothetical protein
MEHLWTAWHAEPPTLKQVLAQESESASKAPVTAARASL